MNVLGLRAGLLALAGLLLTPPPLALAQVSASGAPGMRSGAEMHRAATRTGAVAASLPGMGWAKVYIPRGYVQGRPAPMAVLLHGSGDRGRTMIEAFQDEADRHGVILLAPDSIDYSWDLMVEAAHLRGVTKVPRPGADRKRIEDALRQAVESYSVDLRRIALIGFSDGAGYGLSLGTNNASLFRTVVAFAPGLLTRVESEARGRVLLVHGTQDTVLPVEPTRDVFAPALRDLGFDVRLRLFNGRHEMPEALQAEAFDWWLETQAASRQTGQGD